MNENRAFYAGIAMVLVLSMLILGWLAARSSVQGQLDQAIAQIFMAPDQGDTPSDSVLGTDNAEIAEADEEEKPEIIPDQLYLLINAHRKDNDLTPLKVHPALEKSARAKIQDMVANNYYRHQDVTNVESWYLFKQSGYHFIQAGENLSFGNNSPWQVFDGWINSPAHNEQLLIPIYEDMGLSVDCETFVELPDGGCIVVLHLGAE